MGRKVFVPLSDEMVYEHPEWIMGPVVPYTPGLASQRCSTASPRKEAARHATRERVDGPVPQEAHLLPA